MSLVMDNISGPITLQSFTLYDIVSGSKAAYINRTKELERCLSLTMATSFRPVCVLIHYKCLMFLNIIKVGCGHCHTNFKLNTGIRSVKCYT